MTDYSDIFDFRTDVEINKMPREEPKKKFSKEIVRGLYVLVPLRDYHLAFIQRALELLEKEHREKGLKATANYIRNLRDFIRKYFSSLLKKTKAFRKYLLNHSFGEISIIEKSIPEPQVFLDPDYDKKMPEYEKKKQIRTLLEVL